MNSRTADVRVCFCCGGKLRKFGRYGTYSYVRCGRCLTIQLNPLPTKKSLSEAYIDEYHSVGQLPSDPEECKIQLASYYERLVEILTNHHIAGKILDYGSGWGWLTKSLIDKGFDAQGVELSDEMSEYSLRRGLPIVKGDIFDLTGSAWLSCIVLNAVFEHLVDHEAWLSKAHELLANDGLVISLQPTANLANFLNQCFIPGNIIVKLPFVGKIFMAPWHTAIFSPQGMISLMYKSGFELIKILPGPKGCKVGFFGIVKGIIHSLFDFCEKAMGPCFPLLSSHIFIFKKK